MRILFFILLAAACGRSPAAPWDPSLETSATVLRFSGEVGDVLAPQTLSVVDAHGLNVSWRAVTAVPWVQLSADHGMTPTELRVTVSTRGLAPGTHRTGVPIAMEDGGDNATGAAFIVEVTLQAPGWTALDGPRGAYLRSIAVNPDDSNIIVAGADDGDLWVSADGGAHFAHHDFNSGEPFAAVVFADGRAYAGAEGVYRSDDGGISWGLAGLDNREVWWLAVDPTNNDRLLMEGDGLWRSVDGGANWEEITTPNSSHCLTVDTGRNLFIIGGSDGDVYTTTATTGAGLTTMNTGYSATTNNVASIAVLPSGRWVIAHDVDGSHTPALRVSDDAGATWADPGGAGLPENENNTHLWLTAIGDELYGLHETLVRSRDGGATWESLPIDLPNYRNDGRRFYGAASHPEGLLLAHHALGIVRYRDTGSTQLPLFDFRIRGLGVDASGDIFGIINPGGVFARIGGSFRGIGGTGMHARFPYGFSLDPRSPASMAVTGEDHEIMVTTDGGATWTQGGIGLTIEDGKDIGRAPDDPDVLWVGGASNGLHRSSDNGATWTQISSSSCYHLDAISATEALFFHSSEIHLINSSSGVDTPVHSVHESGSMLRRTSDGSFWFGGRDGLERSTDNGQTFTNLGLGEGEFWGIVTVPGDPTHIFVATASGLLESRDNGATWENRHCPFTPSALAWDPVAGVVVVGTQFGGVYTYAP